MRMGNPSMNRILTKSQQGAFGDSVKPATYGGVFGKSLFYALLTLASAGAVVAIFFATLLGKIESDLLVFTLVGIGSSAIPMLIISLIIAFIPSTVKVLGSIYAIMQGALLGVVSFLVELVAPGIAWAALFGTVIIFVLCISLNKVFQVRVSGKFMQGLMVAVIGFVIVELVMSVLYFVGVYSFAQNSLFFWLQMIISLLMIVWATVMIMYDLQTVDYLVQNRLDKRYEWYVAFAMITTLVYLYLKILELLLRLVALFGRKK